MTSEFFDKPILNSPYEAPARHWELDEDRKPTGVIGVSRRQCTLVTPVPKPRKQGGQKDLMLGLADLSTATQQYDPVPIINEVRSHLESWRDLPAEQCGVTPVTARLLRHWREHPFQGQRPFFCQVEAVETAIWLAEVAGCASGRGPARYRGIREHLHRANEQANPELLRIALKLATGAGKTTVMAMLIAWQTLNAVRQPNSRRFTRGFLVVTPGITIRDRLRVLQPNDPDSYYGKHELIPKDMLPDLGRAKIVITNYHTFRLRERTKLAKGTRALLEGHGGDVATVETEGQMLKRACGELMGITNIVVLNDEAHHCYRERAGVEEEDSPAGDEREEAQKNTEAARLWISGIETVQRKLGVRTVFDLSATPFFLSGSGYREGTLFPWTMCDFSLLDAIECGIVKLPRVPVADNIPGEDMPRYRELWKHIGPMLPKKGRRGAGKLDPLSLPNDLLSAMDALYGHYKRVFDAWERVGIEMPPVFIVVCNNTATSKLVYDCIAGFERPADAVPHLGRLPLFRNYDENSSRLPRPRTLLIDSEQLESGEALDPNFRKLAKDEIDRFRRDLIERTRDVTAGDSLTDADLLREAMNTVGKPGRLGESIRCVVSVAMLSEGWDANTVTHVLGVRAFGTQLLCEQVVGRGLRRQSYELNADGLFEVEYADVLGIPFDFTAEPVVAPPREPRQTIHVHAVRPDRDALAIEFPRVEGYSVELPEDRTVVADDACERILAAIVGARGERRVRVVLDAYNPRGSTAEVDFRTSKTSRWRTDPAKCHVNWAICDSNWEAELCRVVEAHPRVLAYVKNQGMGFTVPYCMAGQPRRYVPDFIVRVDDGRDEPLNLVVEAKGQKREDARIKAETMRTSWVPGVNGMKDFGRWDFVEFNDVYRMEDDLHRWFAENAGSPEMRAAHGLILAGGSAPGLEEVPRRRSEVG